MGLYPDFFEQVITQFRQTAVLEWLGIITAVLCIYLAAKENVWNWPVAIVSSAIYALIYYEYRLYGDSLLQLYFILTAVYGWYFWIRKTQLHEKPVVRLSVKEWLMTLISITALSGLLGLFLDRYTNSDVPYIDGFCTATSFVAQFLMTRKVLESWILWIIVDLCYVPLLIYKQLVSTSVLYVFLVALAIIGFVDWRKTWRTVQI